MLFKFVVAAAAFAAVVNAAAIDLEARQSCSALWGQCGGQGWTGPTCCASGSVCTYSNAWYSQCLQGSGGGGNPTTTAARTTTTAARSSTTTTAAVRTSSTTAGPVTTSTPPSGGSAGCGKNPTLKSGTIQITSSGVGRRYILNVPTSYDKNKKYRLIFGFHWLGGSDTDVATGQTVTAGVWNYYGLLRLSNQDTIFIAPNGLNNGWANTNGQDVTFVDDILKQVQNDLCIDTSRIFSTGFSYGGGMTFSLACSRPNVFRAVAVQSGIQLSGCSGGNSPVPYMHVHGVAGDLDINAARGLRDRFVKNNGCTAASPPEAKSGSKSHVCYNYTGCKAGYPVQWCTFDGGHIAAPQDGASGDSGTKTWVPAEVWAFFTQFG